MRRLLRQLLHQAAFLTSTAALALAMAPVSGSPPVAEAAVQTGVTFRSAVPCLDGAPAVAVTRHEDTMFANPSPASYPGLQTLTPGGAPLNQAMLDRIGSVYSMAYDDGAASGRERLFVAAYTRRFVAYGPEGAGGIYVFERSGTSWALTGSFRVAGAGSADANGADLPGGRPIGASHYYDNNALAATGRTALGGMVVSPDGRQLYVVNIAASSIVRYNLTASGVSSPQPIAVDLGTISSDPAVRADLVSFALQWYPYPDADGGAQLLVGVTDTAHRAVAWGPPGSSEQDPRLNADQSYQVPPRAIVLTYNVKSGQWKRSAEVNLGALDLRHRLDGSGFMTEIIDDYQARGAGDVTRVLKGWNPWRDDPQRIPRLGTEMRYPQPLLTNIDLVRERAPTAAAGEREPYPLMLLGLRDRTGDLAFNSMFSFPASEVSALAQGDIVALRLIPGVWQWSIVAKDYYADDALPNDLSNSNKHKENMTGAVARIPGRGTTVTTAGDTMLALGLAGQHTSGMYAWYDSAAAGGASTFANTLIHGNTRAATKASNLGDMIVLCSYALVGGVVWNDADADGIQDGGAGEPALAGVTLQAFDTAAGAAMAASIVTDATGRYLFAVPPNTSFEIRVKGAPAGFHISPQNAPGSIEFNDSDAARLGAAIPFVRDGTSSSLQGAIVAPWRDTDYRNFDIGLTSAVPTGYVGDQVWLDGDGDGIQDESPLAGYSLAGAVTLKALSSEPGVVDKITTVDAAGNYRFDQVVPGTYQLVFPAPPAGMRASPQDWGGDDGRDSDPASGTYATAPFAVLPDDPGTAAREDRNATMDLGLVAGVDVQLAKRGPAAATYGDTVGYTIEVTNRSGVTAPQVVVADDLPTDLAYVSASPPYAARVRDSVRWNHGGTFTWNLGDLAAGASRTIVVQARADGLPPGNATTWPATNCAAASLALADASPADNSGCATTTISRVEVALSKSGPATTLVGDELAYTLRYTNTSSLPAPDALVKDALPAYTAFVRWTTNPGGVCTISSAPAYYDSALSDTILSCPVGDLGPGASGEIGFVARTLLTPPHYYWTEQTWWGVVNRSSLTPLGGAWPGDTGANNYANVTTRVESPNLTATLRIGPRPLPVGEPGSITAGYRNVGTGLARGSVLTVTHDPGVALGAMPAGCSYSAAELRATCALGDLAPGQEGAVVLPLRLPATPADAASYPGDSFGAAVALHTATPERPAHMADNAASDAVEVVRPNVYVTARGPDDTVRLTWGSGLLYEVGYGNLHRAAPALTRAAATSVLTVTLPADTEFLEASAPPDSVDGQVLVWQLGELGPRAGGGLRIAVRSGVPAGARLRLEAEISTGTPGDDPSDNRAAVDTTVVRPPDALPAPEGALRLAIHSDLDPRHGGADEGDGVYLTPPGAAGIAWPAGEVLDFTPRLDGYALEPVGWPLEYRARVTGWALRSVAVGGREAAATGPDSRGVAGCRGEGAPPAAGSALAGCAYGYVGAGAEGRTLDDFLPAAAALREADMAGQAHVYWTQPPAPPMRRDVYLYTLAPLTPPRLDLAVEVEVWVVNGCPDFLLDPLGACGAPVELPTPGRVRQVVDGAFDVTLVVPRSVVGPAGATR